MLEHPFSYAGVGWPNGPADNGRILALPSPRLLLLASEHWHHDAAVRAGKQVLWRAMAIEGRKPAQLNWSVARYTDEILRHVGDVDEPITAFVGWNELDLNYERGDTEDDFADLDHRYQLLGGFQRQVIGRLRRALPEADLHYGAWTPTKDHRAGEYVHHWREAAESADVVDFHAYDSLDLIRAEYTLYRGLFPGKRLALTEWHCKGDLEEERRVLEWLARTMQADPLFEAAYFFVWRWHAPADWWDTAYDIEHNPDRYALFAAPPVPEDVMPDYRAMARDAASAAGIDPDRFVAQIGVESIDYSPSVIACRIDSPAGARGIAQIVPRFHPTVDPCDPEAALAYAARLMADHLAFWRGKGYVEPVDAALALASYNAGRQATLNGLAGKIAAWPYAETTGYVARILNVSSADARTLLVGRPIQEAPVIKLSDVIARARSRIGLDPYVWDGEAPGGFDCSGFVKWCYGGALTSYTDAIFDETARIESPLPGDIVLYQYADPSQPNTRFPHVALYVNDSEVIDARLGFTVGQRNQLSRAAATRYYRRAPNVTADTGEAPVPPISPRPQPNPELEAARAEIARLNTVVGYLKGDVAAALDKEVAAIRGSLGALEAAINAIRAQG